MAVLFNMIGQGEEIRVREKCGGFMLVVEGGGVADGPFECLCAARAISFRNGGEPASGAG